MSNSSTGGQPRNVQIILEGENGPEPVELFPVFIPLDVATLAPNPTDSFVAGAIEAGYSNGAIADALRTKPGLIELDGCRLFALGEVATRGLVGDAALLPLTAPAPDPRQTAPALQLPFRPTEAQIATAIGWLEPDKQQTKLPAEAIVRFALAWPAEHPYETINLSELEKAYGLKRGTVSARYGAIAERLRVHGVELPAPQNDPRVQERIDALVESLEPASSKALSQLTGIPEAVLDRSLQRLFERGVVRRTRDAAMVRRAAVAVLRTIDRLPDAEIARILEINPRDVASDLRALRDWSPDPHVFNLREKFTLEQSGAFQDRIRQLVVDPARPLSPLAISQRIAAEENAPWTEQLYRRVNYAIWAIRQNS